MKIFFTCQKLKASFLVTRWLFLAALGSVYNHRRRVWCTNSSNLINCIWLLGFDDWGDFGLKTNESDVANDISRAWVESGFTLTLQGCVCRYTGVCAATRDHGDITVSTGKLWFSTLSLTHKRLFASMRECWCTPPLEPQGSEVIILTSTLTL